MGKRRQSRELALKFLYQYDVMSESGKLEDFDFEKHLKSFIEANSEAGDEEIKEFLQLLVKGVCENID